MQRFIRLLCISLIMGAMIGPSWAQDEATEAPLPEIPSSVDENGVNLYTGSIGFNAFLGKIGAGNLGISSSVFHQIERNADIRNVPNQIVYSEGEDITDQVDFVEYEEINFDLGRGIEYSSNGRIDHLGDNWFVVTVAGYREVFHYLHWGINTDDPHKVFTNHNVNSTATLKIDPESYTNSSGTLQLKVYLDFTAPDGTIYRFLGRHSKYVPNGYDFRKSTKAFPYPYYSPVNEHYTAADLDSVEQPNGIFIDNWIVGRGENPSFHISQNNLGYRYSKISGSFVNLASPRCADNSFCEDVGPRQSSIDTRRDVIPQISTTETDGINESVVFDYGDGRQVEADFDDDGVSYVTKDGLIWTYEKQSHPSDETLFIRQITSPTGIKSKYTFETEGQFEGKLRELEVIPVGKTAGTKTTIEYFEDDDRAGLVQRVTYPEGNSVEYDYDMRRVDKITTKPKPSSNLDDMVVEYGYEECDDVNKFYCAKPKSMTDSRGKNTRYKYSADHGGILETQSPYVSDLGGYHKVKYEYDQFRAWYIPHDTVESENTVYIQDSNPVWLIKKELKCFISSEAGSCTDGGSQTLVKEYFYEEGNANKGSNLKLEKVVTRSGDASVSSSTEYGYDNLARIRSQDGPLAGDVDKVWYEYDELGRMVLETANDPDGTSQGQTYTYTRHYYDSNDLIESIETGKTTGYEGSRSFTALAGEQYKYDTFGRLLKTLSVDHNAVKIALTEISYDAYGRPECTAQRMNISTFGTLWVNAGALSACTQTAGERDRISKTQYNDYGQAFRSISGVGILAQPITEEVSFTSNGLVETIKDAKGNLTTYVYDGHDRLYDTIYPHSTNIGAGGDKHSLRYEKVLIDGAEAQPSSLVRMERMRDSSNDQGKVYYAYDELGRITFSDFIEDSSTDVSTTYDVLGNIDTLTKSGKTISYDWDVLGRLKSETTRIANTDRKISYKYDALGRRERLTYPDNYAISYEYWGASGLKSITEHPVGGESNVLVTYTYDDYGRGKSVTSGNGVSQTMVFSDEAGIPTNIDVSLQLNLPENENLNQQTDLKYNEAGQISSKFQSNLSYLPKVTPRNESHSYNGLNQHENLDGDTTSNDYDSNGNLRSYGTTSYSYDVFNRLTSVTYEDDSSVSLSYDAAGRLYSVVSQQETTYFLYDGANLIAEYNETGEIKRRYVHAPGMDSPLVWYNDKQVSDELRYYLIPDERGSIVLITDNDGNYVEQNKYDEFGVPDADNLGRFQYTGQIWLYEIGLYHYKARAYNPFLGRFHQPDPLGYGDGLNMYAYVGNDPINFVDPWGLRSCIINGAILDCPHLVPEVDITNPFGDGYFNPNDLNLPGHGGFLFEVLPLGGANTAAQLSVDIYNKIDSCASAQGYLREYVEPNEISDAVRVGLKRRGLFKRAFGLYRHNDFSPRRYTLTNSGIVDLKHATAAGASIWGMTGSGELAGWGIEKFQQITHPYSANLKSDFRSNRLGNETGVRTMMGYTGGGFSSALQTRLQNMGAMTAQEAKTFVSGLCP